MSVTCTIQGAGSRDTWFNCRGSRRWMGGRMCVRASWTLKWTCHLHSPHTAASLVYYLHSVAIQGWKKLSTIQLYQASQTTQTIDRPIHDYVTAFHSRAMSHVTCVIPLLVNNRFSHTVTNFVKNFLTSLILMWTVVMNVQQVLTEDTNNKTSLER